MESRLACSFALSRYVIRLRWDVNKLARALSARIGRLQSGLRQNFPSSLANDGLARLSSLFRRLYLAVFPKILSRSIGWRPVFEAGLIGGVRSLFWARSTSELQYLVDRGYEGKACYFSNFSRLWCLRDSGKMNVFRAAIAYVL